MTDHESPPGFAGMAAAEAAIVYHAQKALEGSADYFLIPKVVAAMAVLRDLNTSLIVQYVRDALKTRLPEADEATRGTVSQITSDILMMAHWAITAQGKKPEKQAPSRGRLETPLEAGQRMHERLESVHAQPWGVAAIEQLLAATGISGGARLDIDEAKTKLAAPLYSARALVGALAHAQEAKSTKEYIFAIGAVARYEADLRSELDEVRERDDDGWTKHGKEQK